MPIKDVVFIVVLTAVPVLRELLFGVFDHHHNPFGSFGDILHTGVEVGLMLAVGVGISFYRQRHRVATIDKKELQKIINDKVREIEITQQTTIEALATLAEYRNKETGTHLARLREYTVTLAKELKENSIYSEYIDKREKYVENIGLAAILHDVGKVVIPDSILLKSEELTPEEFTIMKSHTIAAGGILEKANSTLFKQFRKESYLALAQQIAYYHHEKWDGTGYPFELSGNQIPLSARIVSLCDVYDALTSTRNYKTPWPHKKALEAIKKESGKSFDPLIVEAFCSVERDFEVICSTLQR